MCDTAVDDCLAVLRFISDWFITSKMLKKFHYALLANDGTLFFDEDFSKFTLFATDVWLGVISLKKWKAFKKDIIKELIAAA